MKLPDSVVNQLRQITQDELDEAGFKMLKEVNGYVVARYQNMSIDRVEANLTELLAIKRQDDACRMCVGWESCPNPDLMKLGGDLTAGGYIHLFHTYCPKNYKKPKKREDETESDFNTKRKWGKKE